MAYLTDKEKRLLFSALSREKEVCKQVDKECYREPYEETLESVVESLERKFYYDRFEKEIRANVIDDFVNLANQCSGYTENCIEHDLSLTIYTIHQIAEEMRVRNEKE